MDKRLKELYPDLTDPEIRLVKKKVEQHLQSGGGKIGKGFLDKLVKGVKNLGSKALSAAKAGISSLAGNAVENGLNKVTDKLREINKGAVNPLWDYKPKPGEKHQLIIAPDGVSYRSRYSGPGTVLLPGLKAQIAMYGGDIDKTLQAISFPSPDVDRESLFHDIAYGLADGNASKVRAADEHFIAVLEKSKDPNRLPALAGIKVKIEAEKRGLPIYSGSEKISPEDRTLLELVQKKLTKLGYGKNRPIRGGCNEHVTDAEIKEDIAWAETKGSGKEKKLKRPSRWMDHVKKYADDNGITFKEAMSAAKASYVK